MQPARAWTWPWLGSRKAILETVTVIGSEPSVRSLIECEPRSSLDGQWRVRGDTMRSRFLTNAVVHQYFVSRAATRGEVA